MPERLPALELRELRSSIRESFPLVLVVHPGARLALRIKHDRRTFRSSTPLLVLAQMEALLQAMATDPEADLARLQRTAAEAASRQRSRQEEELEQARRSKLKQARRRSAASRGAK
jgi:hypothetical protein